jgi:hypothetical protein
MRRQTTNQAGDTGERSNDVTPGKRTSSAACLDEDYFCKAAWEIDELSVTDRRTAKARWKALQESATADESGAEPPILLDAAQIAVSINHSVITLLQFSLCLSIKASYLYLNTRKELQMALPPTLSAYERTFLNRFRSKLGREPHNFGSKERPRYAITYAELLHMQGVPGIDLVAGLDKALAKRLEAL